MSFLSTHALSKHYASVAALEDCSLTVERGEVFGLLGPNGAGKTTLLRLLMGFLRPTSGSATIDGLNCYRQSPAVHAKVAYLPGDARLFRNMRGYGVLRFFSRVRRDGNYARSLEVAERLKLELARQVSFMSTGMRQKLALAAVLSTAAPLVILDEPTSNLDPTVRGEVLTLVREARDAGRTVLFSSHVLSEVEQACDRVAILRGGRLVHLQTMHELRRQHRIRARLMGELPPAPAALNGDLQISMRAADGGTARQVTILTPGELSPLLGWLAQAPLDEVQIEPVGLQAIYDRYHSAAEEAA
ncbi:MAG: ABC transporter ATP-binding protein [Pirellulales bacterium]